MAYQQILSMDLIDMFYRITTEECNANRLRLSQSLGNKAPTRSRPEVGALEHPKTAFYGDIHEYDSK